MQGERFFSPAELRTSRSAKPWASDVLDAFGLCERSLFENVPVFTASVPTKLLQRLASYGFANAGDIDAHHKLTATGALTGWMGRPLIIKDPDTQRLYRLEAIDERALDKVSPMEPIKLTQDNEDALLRLHAFTEADLCRYAKDWHVELDDLRDYRTIAKEYISKLFPHYGAGQLPYRIALGNLDRSDREYLEGGLNRVREVVVCRGNKAFVARESSSATAIMDLWAAAVISKVSGEHGVVSLCQEVKCLRLYRSRRSDMAFCGKRCSDRYAKRAEYALRRHGLTGGG